MNPEQKKIMVQTQQAQQEKQRQAKINATNAAAKATTSSTTKSTVPERVSYGGSYDKEIGSQYQSLLDQANALKPYQSQMGKGGIYGGSYDGQIKDLYGQITGRQPFAYDVDGDALYQQYKDRYIQNAKQGMKDTMGQAAALTGGYGSSYAQGVGQQRFDETMRGLTDLIPTLEQSAYQKYRDQGDALRQQYTMLNDMAAQEQAADQIAYGRGQDAYNQQLQAYNALLGLAQAEQGTKATELQNQTNAYSTLASLITSSGYMPNADELTKAGMSESQANALRQAWIAANPGAAYMQGLLSANDYLKLTGMQPPDALLAAAAGGGGGGGGGPRNDLPEEPASKGPATDGYLYESKGDIDAGSLSKNVGSTLALAGSLGDEARADFKKTGDIEKYIERVKKLSR